MSHAQIKVIRDHLTLLGLPPDQHIRAIEGIIARGPNLLKRRWHKDGKQVCLALAALADARNVRPGSFVRFFDLSSGVVERARRVLAKLLGLTPGQLSTLIGTWDALPASETPALMAELKKLLPALRGKLLHHAVRATPPRRDDQLAEMRALLGNRFLEGQPLFRASASKEVVQISAA